MTTATPSGSAAERRGERGAALVAQHPHWRGIHHPELIALPPRRYSQLDMLPAVERGRAWPSHADAYMRRVERTREIVAQHPRWHGILHPERIFFPEPQAEVDPVLAYRAAVRRALEGVHKSQELCERVAAVAEAIDRRRWPWAASPGETPTPAARRRLPRPPRLRAIRGASERPTRRRALPTGRLVAH